MSSPAAPPVAGVPARPVLAGRFSRLGALPWVLLLAAAGITCVAGADALSRSGAAGGSPLFWLGLGLIVFPAALRLTGEQAGSGERAATVVMVGLALYATKVLRDPFGFTFGDELAHLHNVQEIIATGGLFGSNSILPVTPRYPGLESAAAAVAAGGGVSGFAAGVSVIAAGRVVFMLGVYLTYERLTGSARLAGLGTLIAAAAPTFLFFSAQFSYESLAVPLAGVALFALVRRLDAEGRREQRRWGALVVLAAAGVVPTHHVTAYALALLLLAVCLLHLPLGRARRAPWVITAIVAAMAAAWLAFVASRTVGYLSPVIDDAVDQVVDTITRESETRTLFRSESGVSQTPLGERIVAIVAVGLLALAVVGGLRVAWRDWRRSPVLTVLGLAALAYLASLPLRVVPAAWETASRAGSFLFIGVGVTAAAALVRFLDRGPAARRGPRILAASAVTLFVAGGVIAGWPSSLRLAQPYRVAVDGTTLEPPAVAAARWSRETLGPGRRVGAQDADARLLLVEGRQTALQGVGPDIRGVLDAERLEPWQTALLRDERIGILVTDRRTVSADNIAGYFFDVGAPELAPAPTTAKFDRAGVDRLYDSGDIVIFDVRGLW